MRGKKKKSESIIVLSHLLHPENCYKRRMQTQMKLITTDLHCSFQNYYSTVLARGWLAYMYIQLRLSESRKRFNIILHSDETEIETWIGIGIICKSDLRMDDTSRNRKVTPKSGCWVGKGLLFYGNCPRFEYMNKSVANQLYPQDFHLSYGRKLVA